MRDAEGKPRVSIGMPVYNGERFIEETLDSILAQTFSDFELIISDNASSDRTGEICQAYASKDSRIRYYRNPHNLGASPNYNRVLALALGEYFKWADHDDLIAPTFLQRCVEVLDGHPEVILCYSKILLIDEGGTILVEHEPEFDLHDLGPHQRFAKFMFVNNIPVHLAGLIRSSLLKHVGRWGNYPAADEVLLAELSLHGSFFLVPERLFSLRRHAAQSTFGALIPNRTTPKTFTQRERMGFFDTSYRNRIVLPTWAYLADSLRAIRQAPLGLSQRAYCYVLMARWPFVRAHYRALGKDLLLVPVQLVSRSHSSREERAGAANSSD